MSNGYTFELRWTCPSCGTKNLGRFMQCQHCRAPIPANVEYEDVDELTAPQVSDPALLRIAAGGENWKCEYCSGQVRNAEGRCATCLAPRRVESGPPHIGLAPPEKPKPSSLPGCIALLLLFSCCVGVCLPLAKKDASAPPPPAPIVPAFTFEDVELSSSSWALTEVRQLRKLVHRSGWDAPPDDALHSKCRRKISGYQDCNPYECGTTTEAYDCNPYECRPRQETYDCRPHNCRPRRVKVSKGSESCHCRPGNCRNLKNGFKHCEEVCDRCPVYGYETQYDTCYDKCRKTTYSTCYRTCHRTVPKRCWRRCPVENDWCEYDVYDWVDQGKKVTLSGKNTEVKHKLKAKSGNERVHVDASFEVVFVRGDRQWTMQLTTEEEFRKFVPQTRWRLKLDRAGQIVDASLLDPVPTQ